MSWIRAEADRRSGAAISYCIRSLSTVEPIKPCGRSWATQVQRISPVECAMLFGVAVIVTSLVISTLAAVVVDTAYQAIAERRWPAALPLVAIAVAFVTAAAVAA